jgi:hypothetical protein
MSTEDLQKISRATRSNTLFGEAGFAQPHIELKARINRMNLSVVRGYDYDPKTWDLQPTVAETSEKFLVYISNAEEADATLAFKLDDILFYSGFIHKTGYWYEPLAKFILEGLETAYISGAPLGDAVDDALVKLHGQVDKFVQERQQLIVGEDFEGLLIIAVLVKLCPGALKGLGFSRKPTEVDGIAGESCRLIQTEKGI